MSLFNKTLDSVAAASMTMAGFVRGLERRAVVLAELQCGDQAHGELALGEAIESFVKAAPKTAQEDWPMLFWATLLQTPALLTEPVAPFWDGDLAPLAKLEFAPRAALLLRVVAGLNDVQGATIFGVQPADYRMALQGSLPQRDDGSLDGEAWLALNEEAHAMFNHLPPERVAAVARLREAAVAKATIEPVPVGGPVKRRPLPVVSFAKSGWLGKLRVSIRL